MRVALISYEFPPETLGGIATYARHAVETLVTRGHKVVVYAGTSAESARKESRHGADVHRIPCADRRAFAVDAVAAVLVDHHQTPYDVAEVPDLYAEGRGLRDAAPELPIVFRSHTPLYIASEVDYLALPLAARILSAGRRLLGGLLHRTPVRQVWRESLSRVSFRAHYSAAHDPERQVALEADVVAPPSLRLALRLQADWGIPAERIRILPYAHLPAPDLLALPLPSEARTVAFHGGVRYYKGVHVLAAAMPMILARHPETRFTLAGASGSSPVTCYSLQAWRRNSLVEWHDTQSWLRPKFASLGDHVIFRGFLPPERLVEHLADADICVFPSLFDNFPSACLEAMAAGRAIVATRSGGMEEMLGEEEAGLLVPPGDVQGLGGAVCRLLRDPALRMRLAARARERVQHLYSPSVIGPRYEKLLSEAIARREAANRQIGA